MLSRSNISRFNGDPPGYNGMAKGRIAMGAHFYSIGLDGKILKSPTHPTRGLTMMYEK